MFKRQNIIKSGLNGLAEKYINDNFMAIFSKVSGGNINYTDLDTNTANKINTQWIPFQGEGNLDANYPLECRFYIPPNVKEIKSCTLSAITTNYRMDSDVALSDDMFTTVDVNIALGGSTTVIGQTTTSGGGSMNDSFYVEEWGTPPYQYEAPGSFVINGGSTIKKKGGWHITSSSGAGLGVTVTERPWETPTGAMFAYVDLRNFQHTHKIKAPSHTHYITGKALSHKHEGSAKLVLPKHSHKLKEGIKVSTTKPTGVEFQLNDTKIGKVLSGTNAVQNDLNITKQCKTGWNVIKVLGMGVGRVTLYGTCELIIDPQYVNPVK